jgi:hypothetical protein
MVSAVPGDSDSGDRRRPTWIYLHVTFTNKVPHICCMVFTMNSSSDIKITPTKFKGNIIR